MYPIVNEKGIEAAPTAHNPQNLRTNKQYTDYASMRQEISKTHKIVGHERITTSATCHSASKLRVAGEIIFLALQSPEHAATCWAKLEGVLRQHYQGGRR